jgi:hypothetical protein
MLTEHSKFNRTGNVANLISGNYSAVDGLNKIYPTLNYSINFYPLYQDDGYWNTSNTSLSDFDKFQQNYSQFSNFSTYTAASKLNVFSLAGNISQSNNYKKLAWSDGQMVLNELVIGSPKFETLGFDRLYTTVPSQFHAVSFVGKYSSDSGFTLMPSTNSQMNLWANGDINLNNGESGAIHNLDIKESSFSNQQAPHILNSQDDLYLIKESYASGSKAHFIGSTKDSSNVSNSSSFQIVSLRDIVGSDTDKLEYPQYTLNLSKTATILAGRDIVRLGFAIQNRNAGDITLLQAGRDIRDTTSINDCTPSTEKCIVHLLTGPGILKFAAGRDIDLGNKSGIVTRGNSDNPFLPEGGASILITTAGLSPNLENWKRYLQEMLGKEDANITDFEKFKDAIRNPVLTKSNQSKEVDLAQMSNEQKNISFFSAISSMSATEKNKLFFQALNEASLLRDAKTQKINLSYFDELITGLFPGLNKDSLVGNLSSQSSQIKTEQGGSIDMFTPSGSIYAGLTQQSEKGVNRPSNQGLFTLNGGDINALVSKDFLVNQGRVFTLGGGDITLVSQYGNLEAGKGAKTASSAPPPLIVVSTNGSVSVDFSGSIAGSGIATLSTHPGQPPSSIYAVAPRGYFDAGDAGVRSTGEVKINAPQVRNADNITAAAGISNSQAPAVVAPPAPPPPPPPAASNTADDAKKTLAGGANPNNNLANLSVELLGFGDTAAGSAGAAASSSNSKQKDKEEEDKEKN